MDGSGSSTRTTAGSASTIDTSEICSGIGEAVGALAALGELVTVGGMGGPGNAALGDESVATAGAGEVVCVPVLRRGGGGGTLRTGGVGADGRSGGGGGVGAATAPEVLRRGTGGGELGPAAAARGGGAEGCPGSDLSSAMEVRVRYQWNGPQERTPSPSGRRVGGRACFRLRPLRRFRR